MTKLVLAALLSIVVAFLLSASEAAIWRMSRVRAHELVEERRPGAEALAQIVGTVRAAGATELLTSYQPGEGEPWPFYE